MPEPEASAPPADYDDARTFADPNPVPALQELAAATDTLATVPSTHLA